jgi:hypothetical protein
MLRYLNMEISMYLDCGLRREFPPIGFTAQLGSWEGEIGNVT